MTYRHLILEAAKLVAGAESIVIGKDGMCHPYHGKADAPGVWTIGRGHVIKPGEDALHNGITLEQANEIFADDLSAHAQYIQADIGDNVVLDDWVYGALASFSFNLGARIFAPVNSKPPTIVQQFRTSGAIAGVFEMYKYSNAGGQYRDGLFYRRITEMFFASAKWLVTKPGNCKESAVLIYKLSMYGGTDELRTYFETHHRKDLCSVCKRAAV